MDNKWNWAELTPTQLEKLAEAESSLGVDYLLVFKAAEGRGGKPPLSRRVAVAPLNESQLECLQGLERQLDAVVVAYGNTAG